MVRLLTVLFLEDLWTQSRIKVLGGGAVRNVNGRLRPLSFRHSPESLPLAVSPLKWGMGCGLGVSPLIFRCLVTHCVTPPTAQR